MSTSGQVVSLVSSPVAPSVPDQEACWYAIRTRSRHEKVAVRDLDARGIRVFLPLVSYVRRWSDRRTEVELPLFPGYAFVRVAYFSGDRVRVLQASGVVSFVGQNAAGVSIPDEQVEAIRTLLVRKVPFKDHPFLKVGQRIRVRGGSLSGVEGILMAVKGARSLVISVEPIQRSLCIDLDGYEVEAV
ncbi:MAG: UpxY family transcription antiterminator [Candidatus Sulfotelmatobacter sp.]